MLTLNGRYYVASNTRKNLENLQQMKNHLKSLCGQADAILTSERQFLGQLSTAVSFTSVLSFYHSRLIQMADIGARLILLVPKLAEQLLERHRIITSTTKKAK